LRQEEYSLYDEAHSPCPQGYESKGGCPAPSSLVGGNPCEGSGSASFRRVMPSHGNDDATMKKTAKRTPKIEWSRADKMTAKQRRAAAMADPDNRPMTDEEWAAAPRVPRVRILRRALKLSQ